MTFFAGKDFTQKFLVTGYDEMRAIIGELPQGLNMWAAKAQGVVGGEIR